MNLPHEPGKPAEALNIDQIWLSRNASKRQQLLF